MTTGLVTIQIGGCPFLDAMNTGHAGAFWFESSLVRINEATRA